MATGKQENIGLNGMAKSYIRTETNTYIAVSQYADFWRAVRRGFLRKHSRHHHVVSSRDTLDAMLDLSQREVKETLT